ncbi:transposase [Candidatus Daviesbacteria bacterium]|nr:transposase [Candidatus Daviesbacteria bacterium]
MPGRNTPLVNQEFYHIFNRGVNKQEIFLQPRDYKRFQQTFYYYQFSGPKPKFSLFTKSKLFTPKLDPSKKLVEVTCYCLMPNHFHFLVKQLQENGISTFLSQLSNSFTKYFNTKYKRTGPLLQGSFKSVRVETDEQLIHLSRYIHLNPIVSLVAKKLEFYPWSSYPEYLQGKGILSSISVLDFFPSSQNYEDFVKDQVEYGKSLDTMKHKLIDN